MTRTIVQMIARTRGRRVLALVAAMVALSTLRAAAVSVGPVAVYIDHRTRQGTLTLYNPGDRPEEISIDFGFGYPVSDEAGNVSVPITMESPPGEPSAVGWLRAFPRRLVLEPGQKQVVRVIAEPPPGLAPGEYWARALVRSRGGQAPIEERQGDVNLQIDVETIVVTAVSYRNGAVNTGIEVDDASVWIDGDEVHALVDLRRQGNAAYLGRMLVEVLGVDGEVLGSQEESLAVYRELRSGTSVISERAASARAVRFTFDTQRSDLPFGGALPAAPITFEVPVQ